MSKSGPTKSNNPAGSMKMLRAMVGIGITSALLIVLAFEITLPRVQRLKAEALEKAIFQVLPGTVETQAFYVHSSGKLIKVEEGQKQETLVYAGYDDRHELIGFAVEAAGMGYADVIRILYGYDPERQTLIGFQVLESKETPGLGDKIEKEPHFLDNFTALDVSINEEGRLQNKIITVKQGEKQSAWEIDGISGATISSRAIGEMLGKSTSEMIPILHANYRKL